MIRDPNFEQGIRKHERESFLESTFNLRLNEFK